HGRGRCLAGKWIWSGRAKLYRAVAARAGHAARHRRQRRSPDPPRGQGGGRTQEISAQARRAGLVRSASERPALVKLLRTIQLDPSDTFVFEQAAEPRQWAVARAFAFWNIDPAMLEGKARTAFRSGFLGVSTLGWSTLVQILDANESDQPAAREKLGAHA